MNPGTASRNCTQGSAPPCKSPASISAACPGSSSRITPITSSSASPNRPTASSACSTASAPSAGPGTSPPNSLATTPPTQGEVIQLLGQLYTANLLQAEVPADTHTLFARYQKRKQREISGYLMQIMFARIPIFDPDAFLNKWLHLLGWDFLPPGPHRLDFPPEPRHPRYSPGLRLAKQTRLPAPRVSSPPKISSCSTSPSP